MSEYLAHPFQTTFPAKWVLTGEHAVLRGVIAIALPHPRFHLRLRFEPSDGNDEFQV